MQSIVRRVLFLFFFIGLSAELFSAGRLNVLLIMADDLRDYGGAFSEGVVKTPNLDRLLVEGRRLNGPTCSTLSAIPVDVP